MCAVTLCDIIERCQGRSGTFARAVETARAACDLDEEPTRSQRLARLEMILARRAARGGACATVGAHGARSLRYAAMYNSISSVAMGTELARIVTHILPCAHAERERTLAEIARHAGEKSPHGGQPSCDQEALAAGIRAIGGLAVAPANEQSA